MSQFFMTEAEQEGADLPKNYDGQDELVTDEHGDLGKDDDTENVVEELGEDDDQDDQNDDQQQDDEQSQLEEIDVDAIEVPEITGAATSLEKLTTDYQSAKDELINLERMYEDGEIEQSEYKIRSRELERSIDKLSGKIETLEELAEKEQAALTRYQEQAAQVWEAEKQKFFELPENKAFVDSSKRLNALSDIVDELRTDPKLTIKDIKYLLPKAREIYVKEFGEFFNGNKQQPVVTPTKKRQEPNIPPTLGNVPAAMPNADGDRFAYLDRLSGKAYEAALSKLTPDEQEAYLRG